MPPLELNTSCELDVVDNPYVPKRKKKWKRFLDLASRSSFVDDPDYGKPIARGDTRNTIMPSEHSSSSSELEVLTKKMVAKRKKKREGVIRRKKRFKAKKW